MLENWSDEEIKAADKTINSITSFWFWFHVIPLSVLGIVIYLLVHNHR